MKKKQERSVFAEIYKKTRKKLRFSQGEVAQRVGLSQPAAGLWELGKTEPSLSNLVKVADLFGVSTDYLLGRTDVSAPVTINGNQNAANIVDSTVSIGGNSARLEAEVLRLTRECERLCAENERLRAGQ